MSIIDSLPPAPLAPGSTIGNHLFTRAHTVKGLSRYKEQVLWLLLCVLSVQPLLSLPCWVQE